MKTGIEIVLYCLLLILSFSCKRANNINRDIEIYNEILPLVIQNEYLLKAHMPPPPPPIENKNSDTLITKKTNVINDSLQHRHQHKWKSYFDSINYVLVIHDTLMGSKAINSFINVNNNFLIDDEYNKIYNQLVKGELKSKKIDFFDFKSPENYDYISSNTDIVNDTTKHLIGYLSLSRISLNNNQKKGCFYINFKSKNSLQGFEMFVLIENVKNNWTIIKTTRER